MECSNVPCTVDSRCAARKLLHGDSKGNGIEIEMGLPSHGSASCFEPPRDVSAERADVSCFRYGSIDVTCRLM